MAETQRLTTWGWFVRAFAGGFGAMFGVMTALAVAVVFCYAMIAAGAQALSSFGGVTIQPVSTNGGATVPWMTSTTECPPAQPYQTPVQEAAADQAAQDYPYYTTRAPADFISENPAPQTASYTDPQTPSYTDEATGSYTAIASEPVDAEPVTSAE